MNNPTLAAFCYRRLGRADIEGSKSNVAMNAWLPQASYPCGNFSVTSGFNTLNINGSKGSMGLAFAARSCTEKPSERSLCPFAPRVISVHAELRLGHLRYYLTDVPPQPNSPSDSFFETRARDLMASYRLKRTRPGTREFLTT